MSEMTLLDKAAEAATELHSDIKQSFKSPYMAKVAERLAVIKMSAAERNEYIYYQKQSVHSQDILQAAETKGKVEGKAEGRTEEKIEIAKKMLIQNYPFSDISALTGLSHKELTELKSKL